LTQATVVLFFLPESAKIKIAKNVRFLTKMFTAKVIPQDDPIIVKQVVESKISCFYCKIIKCLLIFVSTGNKVG